MLTVELAVEVLLRVAVLVSVLEAEDVPDEDAELESVLVALELTEVDADTD